MEQARALADKRQQFWTLNRDRHRFWRILSWRRGDDEQEAEESSIQERSRPGEDRLRGLVKEDRHDSTVAADDRLDGRVSCRAEGGHLKSITLRPETLTIDSSYELTLSCQDASLFRRLLPSP
jgi:hypothetical protein